MTAPGSQGPESESPHPGGPAGIDDDKLPDDLVAGDDNPLARPLEDGEDAGDLLEEGKTADESESEASDE